MTFYAPSEDPDKWIKIHKDEEDNVYIGETGATEAWQYINSSLLIKLPVAYVSGSTAGISAIFEGCYSETGPVRAYAKYTTNDGETFVTEAKVLEHIGDNKFNYPLTNLPSKFEEYKVDFFEDFTLQWFIITPLELHYPSGVSKNPLYVTRDKPLLGDALPTCTSGSYVCHESSIHFSCKSAAGLSDISEIIEAIFTKYFKDLKAKDIKGDKLTYWGLGSGSSAVSITKMFKINDGTCGTWAAYMLEMLRIHRITQAIPRGIYPEKSELTQADNDSYLAKIKGNTYFANKNISLLPYYLFMVKDWEDSEKFYPLDYPYFQHTSGNIGASAQNNYDPTSIFGDHVFIEFKPNPLSSAIYYDPAYGIKISPSSSPSNLAKYEDSAIEVVLAIPFKIKDNNGAVQMFMYAIQHNSLNTAELKTIIIP